MDKGRFIAAWATSLLATVSTGAHAAPSALMMPQIFAQGVFPASPECGEIGNSLLGIANSTGGSKASAILNGQTSKLELIALEQSGNLALPRPSTLRPQVDIATPARSMCPALQRPDLQHLGLPTNSPAFNGAGAFLGSKLVSIDRSPFDRQWARVSGERLGHKLAVKIASGSGPSLDTLARVNSWANAHIRYANDDRIYGNADFWARAGTTLRRRVGDCEDIAIVKLQLLAALGFSRSDLYLTVARDLARNSDHAMLVVRLDGKNWLLDNSTAKVLDASQSYDYRPIFSYNGSQRWLHGY